MYHNNINNNSNNKNNNKNNDNNNNNNNDATTTTNNNNNNNNDTLPTYMARASSEEPFGSLRLAVSLRVSRCCSAVIACIVEVSTKTEASGGLCGSSSRWGHANLLCLVPISTDDPPEGNPLQDPHPGTLYIYIYIYTCIHTLLIH